eukprot:gene32227-13595_t
MERLALRRSIFVTVHFVADRTEQSFFTSPEEAAAAVAEAEAKAKALTADEDGKRRQKGAEQALRRNDVGAATGKLAAPAAASSLWEAAGAVGDAISLLHGTNGSAPQQHWREEEQLVEINGNGGDGPVGDVVLLYTDDFTDQQDVCKDCGSLGLGTEGYLIFCTECGEGHHNYCVDSHFVITPRILELGWKCVDCMTCEECLSSGHEDL